MRAIPEAAVALVAKWEGFRGRAYICPAGVLTIGYGHTGEDVREGMEIDESEARRLLAVDLEEARRKIYAKVGWPAIDAMSDNQFAALLSFTYNVGLNPNWRIVGALMKRQWDRVPAELRRFVYAGGKRLKGLASRREEEVALWLKP